MPTTSSKLPTRGLPAVLLFAAGIAAAHDNGLIQLRSVDDVPTATERLVNALEGRGMKVFATIDHAAGAASVDLPLRPTRLVLFGNPKAGTPLMQCSQTTAIDLPQKMLIYEDAEGEVWVSYNNPQYLAGRHHIERCDQVLENVSKALSGLARAAAGR